MKYAVNCSILFKELPLLERPAAARAAGFEAVEFWWPFDVAVPSDHEVEAFVSAISDAGVQLIGLNFFAGDMAAGDRGLVSWVARKEEFRDNVPIVAEIGKRLGCHAFNALYGLRQPDEDPNEQDEIAIENLGFAAEALLAIDGTVLIEPVSGSDGYPLKTADDALRVVKNVRETNGADNVAFLCDLFHLAANGDDVGEVARLHGADSAHVQIADFPGRGEPGTGDLPLEELLASLNAGGYDGWVALEYNPTRPTPESFDRLPQLP